MCITAMINHIFKNHQMFMSFKDTHLIPSDLALTVWSLMMLVRMLVDWQTPLCCFAAHLQTHVFVIFNPSHMQLQSRQVRLDSLVNILSTAISSSIFSLKFNLGTLLNHQWYVLSTLPDSQCGQPIFFIVRMCRK